MDRSLIISGKGKEEKIDIALMENGELVELSQEQDSQEFSVGDIYLARVRKLVPGLNAAFVDVGYKKDAFLHYTDLSPYIRSILKYMLDVLKGRQKTHLLDDFKFKPKTKKTGKVTDVLRENHMILTQILKEPISTKGPRLSCEITLPGRYLVLYPFNDIIGVSKKIRNRKERKRLKQLIKSIKPNNFGVIVRTVAEGKKVAELNKDLNNQLEKWEFAYRELRAAGKKDLGKVDTPRKVYSEVGRAKKILRDLFNTSFNKIVVDEKELYKEIRDYMGEIAPDQKNLVQPYKKKKPIFDHFKVTPQIESGFGNHVALPGGAYLVIEKTEAFHVIDINSGNRVDDPNSSENNAFSINKEAAKEVAKQLRLRDMGGLILIDFIDMKNPKNKKKIYNLMKKLMKKDQTRHTILPLSKLSVMQIARQRVRPAVRINTSEDCPVCKGMGYIQPPLSIVNEIERYLRQTIEASETPFKIMIRAHPLIANYIKSGWYPILWRWRWRFKKWIKVEAPGGYQLLDYRFFSPGGKPLTPET